MKPVVADRARRVLCLRIVPKTGSSIYLTHYPRDLVMGGHTYLSCSGFESTDYTSTTSMSPGMIDLEGIAGLAGISYDAVITGVFDNARAYLFATSWAAPVEDEEPIVASILGKTTFMDKKYRIEEMSLIDALNQNVGKTYTAACPKTFGGQEYAGCKKDLTPLTVTGTVTAVTSNSIIRDSARLEAADYFAAGTIQFLTGPNAGLKPAEIKRYELNGTIEVYEPFHYAVAVGHTFQIIPGCRKRLVDCRDKWNNVINFGGFSNIPTSSQYSQVGTS